MWGNAPLFPKGGWGDFIEDPGFHRPRPVDFWVAPYGGADRRASTHIKATGSAGGLFTKFNRINQVKGLSGTGLLNCEDLHKNLLTGEKNL